MILRPCLRHTSCGHIVCWFGVCDSKRHGDGVSESERVGDCREVPRRRCWPNGLGLSVRLKMTRLIVNMLTAKERPRREQRSTRRLGCPFRFFFSYSSVSLGMRRRKARKAKCVPLILRNLYSKAACLLRTLLYESKTLKSTFTFDGFL